jgi:hypothetical protein
MCDDYECEKPIRLILEHLAKTKNRSTFRACCPDLDFSQSSIRDLVGTACDTIWVYCIENDIPWLNLMVIRSDSHLPGRGIEKWYREKFSDALVGYDQYCQGYAVICENLLLHDVIEIR